MRNVQRQHYASRRQRRFDSQPRSCHCRAKSASEGIDGWMKCWMEEGRRRARKRATACARLAWHHITSRGMSLAGMAAHRMSREVYAPVSIVLVCVRERWSALKALCNDSVCIGMICANRVIRGEKEQPARTLSSHNFNGKQRRASRRQIHAGRPGHGMT